MSYREAKSLKVLLAEINRLAPRRSKRSDGWIGDARHQKGWEASDHNPWLNGVVRARDFTHDPKGGLDCNKLANILERMLGKHPALGNGAYLIWNRKIISTDRIREGWRPYKGANAHTQHLHVSVGRNPSGYDSGKAWGIAAAFAGAVRPVAAVKRVVEVARLRAASRKPGQSVAPTPVRMVQLWLAQLGYDPGPADGIWGKRTQAAFKAFQRDRLGYKGRALNGLPGLWSVTKLAQAARSTWGVR